MKKIVENFKFWLNNARPYSIPITLLSWLVIYVYSIKQGGNCLLGLLAYFGIAIVHLATNLSDDYFDYKRLSCDDKYLENSKTVKCRYLRNGKATINDLRNVIILMLVFAGLIGFILMLFSGYYVILFALAVLPIAILYSQLSSRGLGDIAVILAYGPFMFEGVYYVMTKDLSLDVLILSVSCAMYVNTILYAHMLMDFDEDVYSSKTTLCTKLKTKDNALKFMIIFYILGYTCILLLALKTSNFYYLLTFLTIPLVVELYKSLKKYNENKNYLPNVKFYHYPLDNWNAVKSTPDAPFFLRFMFTRNITTWFMLLTCFAILLG